VSRDGTRLDPDKVRAMREFPKPDKDVGQLQSFLGLVGYFKRHIPRYADIARPLYAMLRGEAAHTKKERELSKLPSTPTNGDQNRIRPFEALKEAASTAPVLSFPDFSKSFILTADASSICLGVRADTGT